MSPNLRKLQLLTGCLIFSGSLNIALTCALWSQGQIAPALRLARLEISNETLRERNCASLQAMSTWEYARLIAELSNSELVEDGFTRAGLALAVLIKTCDFDVERALLDRALQKRSLRNPQNAERYTLLANLKERDFEQIQQFAQQEQWPLTAKGLYKRVRSLTREFSTVGALPAANASLLDAFIATEAFSSLKKLFPADTPDQCLVSIALSLGWSEFDALGHSRDQGDQLTLKSRRQVLLKAIDQGCKPAAYVLLLCDFDFALHSTSENSMSQLLSLLDTYTAEAMTITLEVLKSPRGDEVRELATRRASHFLDLPSPARDDQWKLLAQALCSVPRLAPAPDEICSALYTLPLSLHPSKETKSVDSSERGGLFHIVCPGDTLWKLSKRYGLTVQDLMRQNRLTRDFLHIGQTLQIQLGQNTL